ncbi:helix-turn-helix transcriptional regulator [Pedobacter sp. CFBP9032]|uniref:helix-turn-helix domain-containing protein n=1 Tax=Pedobacter sp. CFBP9032 TaxID=3096539 RepID=UPI002A6B177E|nr:helix-turn-helix transcriptional regulator [Pedobacter sp. CFBP9032]MDY0903798.1 helix-turn-helix transcriptional regulator [Pedobacter sp. CFBP9032]
MENWNTLEYQKIINAQLNEKTVDVTFYNGDRISLLHSNLFPSREEEAISQLTFDDYTITLIGKNRHVIPWDKIRIVTDSNFANAMARKAEESAKSIGIKIKSLRENKNIKSSDLASRAGLTAQTISRIENGHTDLSFATLRKILAAMGYGLKDLATLEVSPQSELSLMDLSSRMSKIGVGFPILKKIIPKDIIERISDTKSPLPILLLKEIITYLSRVFKLENSGGFYAEDLFLSPAPADLAYFKTPKRGNLSQLRAYSHYAYYLAEVVSSSNNSQPKFEYPGDVNEFKEVFFNNYSELNLEYLLDYVWDLGIAVVPLNDPGIFHGASWNIRDKHVIVLKQKSQSHARWIFDLLHEVYHVFVHLEEAGTSILELSEMDPYDNNESQEEREANSFANQVVFGQNSERVVREVLETANYQIEFFKKAVLTVSEKHSINPEFLANNLAFRLQNNHTNWWATAKSFERHEDAPFVVAARKLKEKISLTAMNITDRNILTSALQ